MQLELVKLKKREWFLCDNKKKIIKLNFLYKTLFLKKSIFEGCKINNKLILKVKLIELW